MRPSTISARTFIVSGFSPSELAAGSHCADVHFPNVMT